jgi:uncharacterized membrane protein YesL
MAALRTLWAALVGLYEDTLPLVGGNLAALALNLPLGALLFVVGLPLGPLLGQPQPGSEENGGVQWLVAIIAWLMPLMPTPGNAALAGLAQVAAGPDVPRFEQVKRSLHRHWRLALRCTLVSIVVLVALAWNVAFYLTVSTGWLRFASILWLYGTLFWLSLHLYLLPLMVHVGEPRLFDLYKRAAFITLGHFGYTLVLLIALLVIAFASVIFLPLYVLVGGAFVAMAQAHALREIRRRHGDLVVEPEEEIGRL